MIPSYVQAGMMVQLALAGFAHYVLHWGLFAGLAAGLIALAVFSDMIPVVGPYLTALRKDLLWAAFGCGLIMVGMWIGGRDAAARYAAQQTVVTKAVTNAVNQTTTPAAQRRIDRWDRPEY